RLDDDLLDAGIVPQRSDTAPAVGFDPEPTPEPRADVGIALQREQALLGELRAVKALIEERFGALAFMEKLQRRPAEARLAQKLLDCGFSPMLVRKMADGFNAADGDEAEWAAQILEKNLRTAA